MSRILLFLFMLFWGFATSAQTWGHSEADDGHLVYASTRAGLGLDFVCNAPSAQGLDAMQAGAHEETRVARGHVKLDIGADRLPVGNDIQRIDAMVWLGETGYRLPTVHWNELVGVWEVQLSVSDALIKGLVTVPSFVLSAGDETAWQFAADGLGSSLGRTLAFCENAWAAATTPTPSQVSMIGAAHSDITRVCEGGYTAQDGAFLQGEIDNDAAADVVVWWDKIRCSSAFPRPLCGASHCSAKVFLSTLNGPMDLLAQNASLQPLTNGKIGIKLVGRFDSCGPNSLGCERLWFWNGNAFVEAQ